MPLWRNATRGRPINGVLLLVESFFFVQQVEKKVSLLVAPVKKSFMAGGSRLSLSLSCRVGFLIHHTVCVCVCVCGSECEEGALVVWEDPISLEQGTCKKHTHGNMTQSYCNVSGRSTVWGTTSPAAGSGTGGGAAAKKKHIGRNELRTSQREKSLVPVIWLTPEELKDCSWLVSGVWKLSLACDVTPSSRSRASISSSSLLWISFSFCLSANFAKAWAFLWAIWAFCSSVRPVLP